MAQTEREWIVERWYKEGESGTTLGQFFDVVASRLESKELTIDAWHRSYDAKSIANSELMGMNKRLGERIRELEEEIKCLKSATSK